MALFRKNNLDLNDESLLPKHRVEALCDGIFAIVMTIIILDLKTPVNIIFLMLTGFIPFTVGVLMKYPRSEFTFLLYAINLILISIIMIIHLNYVFSKKNIFTESISEEDYTKTKYISYIPVLIFVISIFVSFYNVRLALYVIYLDPLFFALYRSINYYKND